LRTLKSFLFFGVLLFANSHLHAQIKVEVAKNLLDTVGKKKDTTSLRKDTLKLGGLIGSNNTAL